MAKKDQKLASIFVEIKGDTKELKSDIDGLKKQTKKDSKSMARSFSSSWKPSLGVVTAGVGVLTAAFLTLKGSIGAAINQKRAVLQINQAVKQTGFAARFTSGELQKIASDLQDINGIGDEDFLRNVTANLLTFTNIAGSEFKRAQQAVADVNAVINQGSISGLSSQAIQLGKALNDPVANLGALSRAGIQFNTVQKEQIKNFAKSGELAKAQAMILDEIEKQYGGQAKALNDAAAGTTNLSNAWGDLKEAIGAAFTPLLNNILPAVTKAIKGWIDYLTPYSEKLQQIQLTYEQQQEFLKKLEGTDEEFRKNEQKRLQQAIDKQKELIKTNEEYRDIAYQPFGAGNFVDVGQLDKEIKSASLLIKQYEGQLQAIEKYNKGDRAGTPVITPGTGSGGGTGSDKNKKSLFPEFGLKTGRESRDPFIKEAGGTRGGFRGGELGIIGQQAAGDFQELTVEANEFTATLQAGIESVGDSIQANITSQLSDAIIKGQELNSIFQSIASQLLNVGISAGLNALLPGSGFLGKFLGGDNEGESLGAHNGGTFYGTGNGIMKMAGGGAFTVPPGFPNDSYPLLVESGERVSVTPAGRTGQQEKLLADIGKQIRVLNANTVDQQRKVARLEGRLESTVEGSDIKLSYDTEAKFQSRLTG